MLSDTARKLLMIMRHCSVHHGYMPTLEVLETKSGRTPELIRARLGIGRGQLHLGLQ